MTDCGQIRQRLESQWGSFETMLKNLHILDKQWLVKQQGKPHDTREIDRIMNEEGTKQMSQELYDTLDKHPELEECLTDVENEHVHTIYLFCMGPVSKKNISNRGQRKIAKLKFMSFCKLSLRQSLEEDEHSCKLILGR